MRITGAVVGSLTMKTFRLDENLDNALSGACSNCGG
jgi:hypothetical protein